MFGGDGGGGVGMSCVSWCGLVGEEEKQKEKESLSADLPFQ